ncbi:MAG: TylF/MycF/NovP-related O-methyltransferase [Pontiella sp.]
MPALKTLLRQIYDRLPAILRRSLHRILVSYPVRWLKWKFMGYPDPRWFINEKELRPHYRQALAYLAEKLGTDNVGDYLEFGVCRGSSMIVMHQELQEAGLDHIRLFGFDSFEGLPEDDESEWEEGSFSAHIDWVSQRLADNHIDLDRVNLVKGFYSDSLTDDLVAKHNLSKAGVIMIDCDLYSSTVESLDFCEPLIQDEVIMIFDDWNPLAKQNKGEKRAFDEFLEKNKHFTAEETGNYDYYPGDQNGKVFKVSRVSSA